jgi:hypothetical protein
MSGFRRLAIPLTIVMVALFMVSIAGCKTTKVHKEHDDTPYVPEPDPNPDDGPGPKPPSASAD